MYVESLLVALPKLSCMGTSQRFAIAHVLWLAFLALETVVRVVDDATEF